MTELEVSLDEDASPEPATAREGKVTAPEWALAILLTILVGLSGAALLAASMMELMFDSVSAWVRIGVMLPVLLIATYLLVKKWRRLIHQHDAAKK
jgi:uncharacterized membrane protein